MNGDVILPDGRPVDQVGSDDLRAVLTRLKIPNIRDGDGHAVLAAAYRRHLETVGKRASETAVADWLRGNR